jgi:hypothetical protein
MAAEPRRPPTTYVEPTGPARYSYEPLLPYTSCGEHRTVTLRQVRGDRFVAVGDESEKWP